MAGAASASMRSGQSSAVMSQKRRSCLLGTGAGTGWGRCACRGKLSPDLDKPGTAAMGWL